MESIRKIIKEELGAIISERGGINFSNHPIFSNPEKAAEYAVGWMEKADKMNKFYWQVSHILGIVDMSPIEKLEEIQKMLPNYGWI